MLISLSLIDGTAVAQSRLRTMHFVETVCVFGSRVLAGGEKSTCALTTHVHTIIHTWSHLCAGVHSGDATFDATRNSAARSAFGALAIAKRYPIAVVVTVIAARGTHLPRSEARLSGSYVRQRTYSLKNPFNTL
jgi:hypothetical protein